MYTLKTLVRAFPNGIHVLGDFSWELNEIVEIQCINPLVQQNEDSTKKKLTDCGTVNSKLNGFVDRKLNHQWDHALPVNSIANRGRTVYLQTLAISQQLATATAKEIALRKKQLQEAAATSSSSSQL